MTRSIDRTLADLVGPVPADALPLAVLELSAPSGLVWRERVWLVRAGGQDQLWAAVCDAPDRAIPVAAAGQDGSPDGAGARLLAGYLAEARAELLAIMPEPALAGARRLAAFLSPIRRGNHALH